MELTKEDIISARDINFLFNKKFKSEAKILLAGCSTAEGQKNIAHEISSYFPLATV